MAEEVKDQNETGEQNATVESNEVDYDKELETVMEKAKNNTFAQKRISQRESKVETEDEPDRDEKIARKVIEQVLPVLKSTVESSSLDQKIERMAGGNESHKKLIRFHYDNSTNPSSDLDSRLEVAFAAANRKAIDRKTKEINVAFNNRKQISNVSLGSSSEQNEKPGPNVVSQDQLKELERRADSYHFTPAQKKKFVDDALKRLATNR